MHSESFIPGQDAALESTRSGIEARRAGRNFHANGALHLRLFEACAKPQRN
jgi:hypothetical protein